MYYAVLAILFSVIIVTGFGQQPDTNSNAIIRSNLGFSGTSKTFIVDDKQFNVSQSIGQASVIGTYGTNKYTLLQGYQHALISAGTIQKRPDNSLEALVFPNPFHQSVNISFKNPVTDDIIVHLSDVMGKTVVSQNFNAAQLLILNLNNLRSGIYVLIVKAGEGQYIGKLTKQ